MKEIVHMTLNVSVAKPQDMLHVKCERDTEKAPLSRKYLLHVQNQSFCDQVSQHQKVSATVL